jgi:predicted transcriptional regulator
MKVKKRSSPQNLTTTPNEPPDLCRIEDAKTARYLLVPEHQTMLKPFMAGEVTVTQVAQTLNLDFRKSYSFVKRLERYGLIRMVRLEQRDGRPIRFYRASAKHFFVPISLVPIDQVMQIVNGEFEQRFAEQFVQTTWGDLGVDSGIQIWDTAHGISCLLVQKPHQVITPLSLEYSATYGMWHQWSLNFEDAKALQRELFALSEKYSQRKNGSQKYLVRLAMTPLHN